MSVFSRFPERLQHAIAHRLGFASLREVQEQAGEAILDGKNAVVLAPTAGGKTEAALFPILAGLLTEPTPGIGAIYVAPIKALLNNQEVRLGEYTEMVGLSRFVWHGDTARSRKQSFLREPAELLMTTPESLEVMLMSPRVPAPRLFKGLRYAVIDETHAFAGADRGAHLMSVLERLRALYTLRIRRPAQYGPKSRARLRQEELPGALRGLLEPRTLQGPDRDPARARKPRASLR